MNTEKNYLKMLQIKKTFPAIVFDGTQECIDAIKQELRVEVGFLSGGGGWCLHTPDIRDGELKIGDVICLWDCPPTPWSIFVYGIGDDDAYLVPKDEAEEYFKEAA